MTNSLIHSNSPYLLQHAQNPVDWLPWGPGALDQARRENKPIFLSIGYAACHWCHVMAHESFEDLETARMMNEHFVNVKVDREERPDVDQIYMQAVVAMTGQGGWPLSVFLTPEGKPFYGGTYFPPQPRQQLPSFTQLLASVAQAWKNDRENLLESAGKITSHLEGLSKNQDTGGDLFSDDDLENAVDQIGKSYDWKFGGWGRAPKFPQAMTITFLLAQAKRGNEKARELAVHALESMARGGMHDLVGGGFSRYSVDRRWLVPHFEKMLYDNALLARAYLHAFLLTRKPYFRQTAERTLDFISRELLDPQGGFYASLDADSEGEEGKFYTWTLDQLQTILRDHPHWDLFSSAYTLIEEGNFEGKHILQQGITNQELEKTFDLDQKKIQKTLDEMNSLLFEARAQRVRPATDDKVLTSWNGLTLWTFAEAARYLNREDYAAIAVSSGEFLLDKLKDKDSGLLRSWRQGQADHPATLEDYGALILGLTALYQLDPRPRWFQEARKLTGEMMDHFFEPEIGFFDTPENQETLPLRPRDTQDNATPSGSSLAVYALLTMAAFTMDFEWQETAEDLLAAQRGRILQYPTAFGMWLGAADLAAGPTTEVALIGEKDHPGMQELLAVLHTDFQPRLFTAQAALPLEEGLPELLEDRPQLNDLPTAYLCRNFVCLKPTSDPAELQDQLEDH